MIKNINKYRESLLKKLMFAYVTGITFLSTMTVGHAQVGELVQAPVDKVGSELNIAVLPAASLLVLVCGVLLLLQKKKLAGMIFVGGAIGIFVVKNYNAIGSFVKGL